MSLDRNEEELLLGIAYKFCIDTTRYMPVKVESAPFLALYCIDLKESKVEGREWFAKFDILPADIGMLKTEFGSENFDFAVSEKYRNITHDEGNTIDFPESED